MRHLAPALLIAVAGSGVAAAQETVAPPKDVGCIVRTALDFLEGAITSDAERVARSSAPSISTSTVETLPDGRNVLGDKPRVTGQRAGATPDATVEVVVFEAASGVASARAVGGGWSDLLQLMKLDGKWKVVSVLRSPNEPRLGEATAGPEADDSAAVMATVLDYARGLYEGDASKLERTLHPAVSRVFAARDPATGRPLLHRDGAHALLEGARSAAESPRRAVEDISVTLHHVGDVTAAATVLAAQEVEHLQLARLDGVWKVVAVLSAPAGGTSDPVS